MAHRMASRLQDLFETRTDSALRSIVTYNADDFEIVYLREDVASKYTNRELNEAINEARMESLYIPIYENTFSADHGELRCMINCFENVIEMNFALGNGIGAAVALDERAMQEAHGLVTEAHSLIVDERDRS